MADHKHAKVNSATKGVRMPEIRLADGSTVQTGTVGALLVSIGAYNKAHAEGDEATMAMLRGSMKASLPLLDRIGFFDLFTPEEWINDTESEGRRLVGQLFLEFQKARGKSQPS